MYHRAEGTKPVPGLDRDQSKLGSGEGSADLNYEVAIGPVYSGSGHRQPQSCSDHVARSAPEDSAHVQGLPMRQDHRKDVELP